MKFRKLYWTSESLPPNGGCSELIGVYTSIPDLIRCGLRPKKDAGLRLTLVKLDSSSEPLGVWTHEDADRLPEALSPFIATEEFTTEAVIHLSESLKAIRSPIHAQV